MSRFSRCGAGFETHGAHRACVTVSLVLVHAAVFLNGIG
jgi:hypothetical protein